MQNNIEIPCPLCQNSSTSYFQNKTHHYYQCQECYGIFMGKNYYPKSNKEKAHYQAHNNDVFDPGYQKFVSPITNSILRDFLPTHKGLDFGAGTGPVISKVLADNSYSITQYDPYFHKHPEVLKEKYDYIACCEVIEHFHDPQKEFRLLKDLLLPGGKLYCMTDIYEESIDFEKWYYKNDPTHVFFYLKETLNWIRREFGFSNITIEGRLVIFSK